MCSSNNLLHSPGAGLILAVVHIKLNNKNDMVANNTSPGRRVAVIGSGISGIASAAMLQKNGFQVQIFEKSAQIGGVWALAYPNVRLQNIAEQYHISDFPWPFQPDLHPTGNQIMRYLEEAVQHFHLNVCLRHTVTRLQEQADGWLVAVQTPDGSQTIHVDFVMVSNGHYSDGKNTMQFPGQDTYLGKIMTERDVKSPDVFTDQRVAVVGFGKSAVDMAEFAARQQAHQVFHIFRNPRWMLPRRLFGLHFTHILFNRFGSVMMPSWSHPSAMERFLHTKSAGFVRTFWKKIEGILRGKILQRGARLGPEAAGRLRRVIPDHPLLPDLRSASCLEPENYYQDVAAGRILPFHAEIEAFHPLGLRLKNGIHLDCDVVMLSLGSQTPAFPFMPPEYRALLESEPDGVQLYRHLVHPHIPRIGFAGYNHGFMHVPAVEVGTLWLAALWKGHLELPPVAEMEASATYIRAWKRAHIHFEPSRSCGVNTRFQQYIDTLLQDLGVSPYRKLPNVVAEVFARYRASDYSGVYREYVRRNQARGKRQPLAALH